MSNKRTTGTDERPGEASITRSFQCRVIYVDDRARITTDGYLDGSTVPVVRRMVLSAAALPLSGVTLDLAGVCSIDPDAVDVLVALRHQLRGQTSFSFGSISASVRRALAEAGVAELFDQDR